MSIADDLHIKPWSTLWSQRRSAALGMALGAALAIVLCAWLPSCFEARMTVGPSGRGAGADLSAFLPATESPTIQYLLQRVGSVTAADFSIYEMLMTSPRVAAALIKDDAFKNKLHDLCDRCGDDSAALARWLDRHVRVRPVGATQMRRVSLRMKNGKLATDLLRALHRLSDETIRADARIRTDQRMAYLREQLGHVSNPDHRDTLVSLLKEQERMRMMVGIDNDFAAEAIDPPTLSDRPAFPDPYVMIPIFLILGGIVGTGVGLIRANKS